MVHKTIIPVKFLVTLALTMILFLTCFNTVLASEPVSITEGFSSISGKYDRIWAYDNMMQQWMLYDTSGTCFSDFSHLTTGQGYWIHTTQSCTLSYGGYVYNLDYGWNLVGWLG